MVSRFQEIDILRSMAIIFVIFAHIDSYTKLPILEKLDGTFAVLGLTIFFFISGFLMQLNNKFNTYGNIYSFFKKRATKIYPLYWLSIALICVMNRVGFDVLGSNDIDSDKFMLLLNVLGFQGFFSENYSLSIWWFVGVILLYYLLFSIILCYSKNIESLLIYSFFAVFPLLFLKNEFNMINVNVFVFYFIFIAGILSATAESLQSLKKITLFYSILLFVFLLLPYFGINADNLADIKHDIFFLILLFVFTLYKIKTPRQSMFKLPKLVKNLADSSYSTYLFHIPILTVFETFVNSLIPLDITNSYLSDYLTLFIGIPFTLFMGYYIMIYFNKLYEKLV
ncbi:acyltransferase [Methanosarcina sp. KYL-1]|uniref:acyltransferase family protein n=1 Tax=Methanosarcina sp. KYL-1 TaxID=2602068 RepID=UPI00210178B5|nr:acyltransferase [Methanosarcina sp. KYL-1]